MDADKDAIRRLIETWLDATRAGDVDTVLGLMAPDVVFLVAGQPPMQGRDAFETALRTILTTHAIESKSAIDEIAVEGNMAYCRTQLEVTVTSKHGGTPLLRKGHTMSILRKSGGKWLLTRDANMLGAPA